MGVKSFVALRFITPLTDPNQRRQHAAQVLSAQGFKFPITIPFPHDPPITLKSVKDIPTVTTNYGYSTLVEWRTA